MLALAGVGFLGASFLVALVFLRAIRTAPYSPSFLQWIASDGALIVIAACWVLAGTEFLAAMLYSGFDVMSVGVTALAIVAAAAAFRWLLRRDDRQEAALRGASRGA